MQHTFISWLMMYMFILSSSDMCGAYDSFYTGISSVTTGTGLVVGYMAGKIISDKAALVCALAGAAGGFSLGQGLHNTHTHYDQIEQYKAKYGIVDHLPWYGFLLQPLLAHHDKQVHVFMHEVQKKLQLCEAIDSEIIWNFQKFKHYFPHEQHQKSYHVAKSYLVSFGYKTIKDLKAGIIFYLNQLEKDIKKIMNWTSIGTTQRIHTFKEFQNLQIKLFALNHAPGFYVWLGACGYSGLYNGQRVTSCAVNLYKVRAYVLQLQELLQSCHDDDETQLDTQQGFVEFSLS